MRSHANNWIGSKNKPFLSSLKCTQHMPWVKPVTKEKTQRINSYDLRLTETNCCLMRKIKKKRISLSFHKLILKNCGAQVWNQKKKIFINKVILKMVLMTNCDVIKKEQLWSLKPQKKKKGFPRVLNICCNKKLNPKKRTSARERWLRGFLHNNNVCCGSPALWCFWKKNGESFVDPSMYSLNFLVKKVVKWHTSKK